MNHRAGPEDHLYDAEMTAPTSLSTSSPALSRDASVASRNSSTRRKPVPTGETENPSGAFRPTYSTDGLADASGRAGEGYNANEEPQPETSPSTAPLNNPAGSTPSHSSRDPYSSTSPSAMTAAAYPSLSRNGSNSSRRRPEGVYPGSSVTTEEILPLSSVANGATGNYHAALASRPSLHSRRSSIAPESVFGTAPQGVIGKTKPRELIRVERDFSAGETYQFWSGWVWELEGRVSPTDYQNTLNELNTVLASAHDPYKSILDNCLAVLTLYISPYIVGSHYEREMKKFHRVLENANRTIYNPAGLNFLSPWRNAYLFLEIEYY
ncbi:hypothetical protein JCM11641_007362 [Rhodosporidiobolus odoratus]